jgi:hypothetical protein
MNCSCIQGNYGYHVEAIDKDTIIYQDLSEWVEGVGYELPESYILNVTTPGSSTPTPIDVSVSNTNRIPGNQLSGICDGVYCFQTTSCGITYSKFSAIFPNLDCCVKQAWATLDSRFDEQIREIESQLKRAKINAELDNPTDASNNLKIAKKLLENLKCDCDC